MNDFSYKTINELRSMRFSWCDGLNGKTEKSFRADYEIFMNDPGVCYGMNEGGEVLFILLKSLYRPHSVSKLVQNNFGERIIKQTNVNSNDNKQ